MSPSLALLPLPLRSTEQRKGAWPGAVFAPTTELGKVSQCYMKLSIKLD